MIRSLIALLLLALAASPLSAQREIDEERIDRSQTGTRFKVQVEAMAGDEARVFIKRMGRCLARSDRELATRVLANSDSLRVDYDGLGMEFQEVLDELNMKACFKTAIPRSARYMRINYNSALVRGMLAEEMYLHANDDPVAIADGAPVDLENRFFVGLRPNSLAVFRAKLSDCVVFNAVQQAHNMLDANPNSKKEREAAQALAPVFGQCLGGDDEVTFNLTQMRSFLADGLWARSHYGRESSQAEAAE